MHRLSAAVVSLAICAGAHAAGKPEDDLAAVVRAVLDKSFAAGWEEVEKLPNVRWAPLPPNELKNCLPDGGCYVRHGAAVIAGRKLAVVATGARTIVSNIYLRNAAAPFGEAAVVIALKEATLTPELARCPATAGGGTNWYRLSGAAVNPGVVSIQTSCNGKPCEGFVLTLGGDLPPLQPNQLRLYSEQCSAPATSRKPVATVPPHEQLAQTIAALLPPAAGPVLYDWKALAGLPAGIEWPARGPRDSNSLSTQAVLSGRRFSVQATGTPSQVKVISFDEGGMHPKGEHMLGALYSLGYAVKLVRCGPVYTESTNNWHSIASAKSKPVMLRQSIRYDGNQVQDSYELRLDGTLPARDPRDRDPGVNGCR